MEPRPKTPVLDRQGRRLFVSMVIAGYMVTFVFNAILERRIPIEELFLGILLGVIYLVLGLNDHVVFNRLPAGWASLLFFSVQCSLVFGIGFLLGIGNLVMGLPLVVFAVERLTPPDTDTSVVPPTARSTVAYPAVPAATSAAPRTSLA